MNKRKLSLMLAGLMVVSAIALVGCGDKTENGSNSSNGTTTEQSEAKEKKVYSLEKAGEKDTTVITLTYEDGKPVDGDIDVITANGSKKELSEKGEYVMKEGEENSWHEQAALLINFLKENKFDLAKVAVNSETNKTDAVTGVTIKVNEYVTLMDELMGQVEAGTATEVTK